MSYLTWFELRVHRLILNHVLSVISLRTLFLLNSDYTYVSYWVDEYRYQFLRSEKAGGGTGGTPVGPHGTLPE